MYRLVFDVVLHTHYIDIIHMAMTKKKEFTKRRQGKKTERMSFALVKTLAFRKSVKQGGIGTNSPKLYIGGFIRDMNKGNALVLIELAHIVSLISLVARA